MNFAIIGCGRIAPRHAQSIESISGARLVAACDIVPNRVESFVERHGGQAYTDHRQMLERKDIDVVCVCVPSGLHASIGQDAAQAGKNVLVEKPISLSLEDAESLIRTCEEQKVTLGVVLQNRFNPPMQDLRRLVDHGKLGKLLLGSVTVRWFRPQSYYEDGWHGTLEMDGGALMNQSIHHIDALQWLMGEPLSVFSYVATLAH
jgi:predicted dehydrogenase